MDLVKVSKQRLQVMRDDGWASLLAEVFLFCTSHDIPILDMEAIFVVSGRPWRNTQQNTNLHHYRVELFYTVIDMQLQELNNHFFWRIPICYFVWLAWIQVIHLWLSIRKN